MIFNQNKCVEIYHLNQQNCIIPELFFVFNIYSGFNSQVLQLTNIGYKTYMEKYTIFNKGDYFSPIFISDNELVGYAYIFNNNKIYKNDWLQNRKLIGIIKLYFYYEERKIKNNEIKTGKYHLVSSDLIKRLKREYDEHNLEQKLNEINEAREIINLIKKGNNEYSNLLTYKKIYFILKELPNEIKNINNSNNYSDYEEELQLNATKDENIFYYENFELITDDIYNSLFKNKNKDYLNKYYLSVNSTKKYLYFTIPEIINSRNEKKYILEVGILQENIFNPYFILVYNTKEIYEQSLNDYNNNLDSLLDKYDFGNKNFGKLYDHQNNVIGLIYCLGKIPIKIIDNEINLNSTETMKVLDTFNNQKVDDYKKNEYVIINKEKAIMDNNENNNNENNNNDKNNNNNNDKNNDKNKNNHKRNLSSETKFVLDNIRKRENKLKIEFKEPMLIGLQFIGGAPIYMNSILQCFCQNEELVNYFKYNEKFQKFNAEKKGNLTDCFKHLIDNLWPSQKNDEFKKNLFYNGNNYYLAPYEIKNKLFSLEPNFQKSISPNDLINYILNYLHSELNKKEQNNKISQKLVNYSNQEEAFNNFLDDFKMNISKISDIFYGIKKICSFCPNCNLQIYEFKTFYSLNFDLLDIKSFKMENQNYNNFSNIININDCLDYYRRNDYKNGNNIFCQGCQSNKKYSQITSIYSAPKALIISLNIKKELQNQIQFKLEECLNLSNYVEKPFNQWTYNLKGIVACDLQTGQYIAYCKNPINQQWYKYIEDLVNLINNNILDEINNSFFPCVLFYQIEN